MIKGIIFMMLVMSIFQVPYNSDGVKEVENDFSINAISPRDLLKIDEVLSDNSGALSEQEKEDLLKIKEKLESYQMLQQDEIDFIRDCDLKVIRNKLGDAKFEEYSKLIKKRAAKSEFDQVDRLRLFELEKEIKGIK